MNQFGAMNDSLRIAHGGLLTSGGALLQTELGALAKRAKEVISTTHGLTWAYLISNMYCRKLMKCGIDSDLYKRGPQV